MNVTKKISIMVIVLLFFMVFSGSVGFYALHIVKEAQNLVVEEMELLNTTQDIRVDFQRVLMPANDYLVHADQTEIEEFKRIMPTLREEIKKFSDKIGEHLYTEERFEMKHYEEGVYKKEIMPIFDDISQKLKDIEQVSVAIFALENPIGNIQGGEMMEYMDMKAEKANTKLDKLAQIFKNDIDEGLKKAGAIRIMAWWSIGIAIILFLIIGLSIGGIITRQIQSSMKKLLKGIDIISNGNFEYKINMRTKDEFSELGNAFNLMADKLKQYQYGLVESEKLAAIGKLTSGIVHDINNPLSVVTGRAQLLLADYNKDEKIKKNLDIILGQTKRATFIAKKFLRFVRNKESDKKVIEIKDVIEEAIELLSYQIKLDNVKIITKIDDDTRCKVLCNADEMSEVFINLLLNSMDAMPDGGEIKINAYCWNVQDVIEKLDKRVLKNFHTGDSVVRIDFSDNGKGMDQETLKNIFKPFFTTKEKGTGLGTHIVAEIINNHKGVVTVSSQINKGTTFNLFLPLAV